VKPSPAIQKPPRTSSVRLVSREQMFEDMKPVFDDIARRAFEIFDANGRRLGHDLDDWHQAEAELLRAVQVDLADVDDALMARIAVPGFSEKDIGVTVEPQRLTIGGRRELSEERRKGKTLHQFYRTMALPAEVDPTSRALETRYEHGVLSLTLPKMRKMTGRAPIAR
jgi:HSP20 family molecular chaperone IbpA